MFKKKENCECYVVKVRVLKAKESRKVDMAFIHLLADQCKPYSVVIIQFECGT